MTPFRIPLKAVLYKEDGVWLAHCLEMDLIGDGPTSDQAFESLKQAIVTQIAACVRNNCIESLFVPAEGRLWRMFAHYIRGCRRRFDLREEDGVPDSDSYSH